MSGSSAKDRLVQALAANPRAAYAAVTALEDNGEHSCRAEGWTDYKGFISEPDPDERRGYEDDFYNI